MFDPEIIEKLRKEFPDIPLLIFHRSCEYAESVGDLFDILSGFRTNIQRRGWRMNTAGSP
jgi:hypothetical protein